LVPVGVGIVEGDLWSNGFGVSSLGKGKKRFFQVFEKWDGEWDKVLGGGALSFRFMGWWG
jgi:hypothetical protein